MRQSIGRPREQAAVVTVTAPDRSAPLSGRALLIGACYLSVGACVAWAIRSVVESRPAEFFGAWLVVSIVVARKPLDRSHDVQPSTNHLAVGNSTR